MMLTQADIDAAVAESLAKTQELMREYGEQFVRPMMEMQQRMQGMRDAGLGMRDQGLGIRDQTGGKDGQWTTGTTDEYADNATARAGL